MRSAGASIARTHRCSAAAAIAARVLRPGQCVLKRSHGCPLIMLVAASLSRGVGFPQLLPPSVSTYAYKSCVTIQKAPGRQRWIPRKALCYNVRCVVS